jgi:hypothetical protein
VRVDIAIPCYSVRWSATHLMHRRSLRYGLVALLFASAAGVGAFAWNVDRQLAALTNAEHAAASRFDALVQSIARFDAAQQTFDPAREAEADWFGRVRKLLDRIRSEGSALRGSAESAAAARTFSDITDRVATAVGRAEENFRDGHDLMAADLVHDEGRPGAEAMRASVLEWRAAEAGATDSARAVLFRQLWTALGGTAALWAIGVLLLAPRSRTPAPVAGTSTLAPEPAADAPLSVVPQMVPREPPAAAPEVASATGLSLGPAASLCSDIARADSAADLETLVERAATVLDAKGIVVWLKGRHDELVPAIAHGYGPHALARIGVLPLADLTLTTRAWHAGELQVVSGDGRTRAALAAPMFQGAQATGVFAVELSTREASADARALAGILAAQFAGAVTPLPDLPAEQPIDGAPNVAVGL